MTYEEATSWLFKQIPNYQNQGGGAYKPGLDRITTFLERLGNPHLDVKVIHVAGTNGKGSVCHMLGAALQSNSFKVGIFSSPHVFDFTERVKINGAFISKAYVSVFIREHQDTFLEIGLSFFEITAALAFKYFKEEKVDFAIIETGLGGRLDATNVVDPFLSIITNIGIDHTQFLGTTIREIAGEKAGIIKRNKPVVLGDKSIEVNAAVVEKAIGTKSELYFSESNCKYKTTLKGDYQTANLLTTEKALEVIEKNGFKLNRKKIQEGLNNVENLTRFFGRFQTLSLQPNVIVDVAHNADGVKQLIQELNKLSGTIHLVFGGSKDKDLSEVFKLFSSLKAKFYLTTFSNSRSTTISVLAELGTTFQLDYKVFNSVKDAFEKARINSKNSDTVVVCGSFFLLADLEFLKDRFFQ